MAGAAVPVPIDESPLILIDLIKLYKFVSKNICSKTNNYAVK